MTSFLRPAPEPKSLLGYHRVLSPKAGVRVSPLCLGTMNFGTNWRRGLGEVSKEDTFKIIDYFYDQGGNFIDTANFYQAEQSEEWLGDWMAQRGNRDQMVIATKYTMGYRMTFFGADEKIKSNFQGNHSKSLKLSLEASLRKLQTTYVDLLYVHFWDFTTSVEELMQSLHALVLSGKVLHLGISDTPAWLVVECNAYARDKGLTQFSVYQGQWSAERRDFERDIIQMCEWEGMALCPWGALGRGFFKKPEDFKKSVGEGRNFGEQSERQIRVVEKLDKIAKARGTAITSVALAYVRYKAPYVFPLVGGRKVEHLEGNIQSLSLELSDEELDEIDDAEPFDIGFPMNMLFEYGGGKYRTRMTSSNIGMLINTTRLETVPKPKPLGPVKVQQKMNKIDKQMVNGDA